MNFSKIIEPLNYHSDVEHQAINIKYDINTGEAIYEDTIDVIGEIETINDDVCCIEIFSDKEFENQDFKCYFLKIIENCSKELQKE